MTERLSHKRDCLYKDKITCLKSHLFVLEKADYTYNDTVIRQAGQPTHLPVICSIPSEYSNAIVHAFQKFRAPFSGKIVHIFPEQSAVI